MLETIPRRTIAKSFNEMIVERGRRYAAAGNVEGAERCLAISKKAQERERRKKKRRHELTDKEKKRQRAVARKDPEHFLAKSAGEKLHDVAQLFAKDTSYPEAVCMASEAAPYLAEEHLQAVSKLNAARSLSGDFDLETKAEIEEYVESKIAKGASVEDVDDAISPALFEKYMRSMGFEPLGE